ncbi:MAG: hypothetical protein M3077_08355 [Candidatus Dormibacteraeota bacterium]|nr:hypothetical protein [Candidatus Dormibacteraeota bacterium]
MDRNRDKRGRLLFGAIRLAEKAAIDAIEETEPYDRFPLPADVRFEGGILDLRRLFMVDVRDVSEDPADRVASLTDETALQLAVRWAAYANRRGPLVALRNAEKLAKLLAGSDSPSAAYLGAAQRLAEVVGSNWELEAALEEVENLLDSGEDPRVFIEALIANLDQLTHLAGQASEGLRGLPAHP